MARAELAGGRDGAEANVPSSLLAAEQPWLKVGEILIWGGMKMNSKR